VIELVGVSKRYGDAYAVKDVTIEIAKGEFVAVLGESGSGKTTVVKMINRLVEPSAGIVRIAGKDVRDEDVVALRRRIGYVIQQVGLLPHLTVGDNVATVPKLLGWEPQAIDARVAELLDLVGLPAATYARRFPDELSGGQRQRVGVARAVAARPQLLLLDEPFGALDPITRLTLQRELKRIHRELGLTSVMVTHDMVEAFTLADRIAVMFRGELRQLATPQVLVHSPADDYVKQLVAQAREQAAVVQAL
jgi:osmoprotectant transport system ATP-binding protein